MGVLEYSVNLSDHLLSSSEEFGRIKQVVDGIRVPMCPGYIGGPYPVNQKILNAMFRHKFHREWGWESSPLVAPGQDMTKVAGDFSVIMQNGLRVFIEVEFGNVASIFRDLFKFIYMKVVGSYDVGILIVPSEKDDFSKEIEAIYSFQGVRKILEASKGSISVPVLLLGIEPDRGTKESGVWSNDIDCYALEPDWPYRKSDLEGEKSKWKSQSEPFWDEFVLRHQSILFDQ